MLGYNNKVFFNANHDFVDGAYRNVLVFPLQ
jgi:hypothetical protein